jgi:transcriptional regulator with XRE-family HTH domain
MPQEQIARLRAALAARRIPHKDFADVAGLGRCYVSRILCGYPAGELATIKIQRAIAHLGLDQEVRRAS